MSDWLSSVTSRDVTVPASMTACTASIALKMSCAAKPRMPSISAHAIPCTASESLSNANA